MVKGKSNMDAHNLVRTTGDFYYVSSGMLNSCLVQDAHSSDGSSWQCDLCDHVSSRKSNLATHMKTHQRPREYICPICPDNHRFVILLSTIFVSHAAYLNEHVLVESHF